jgi:hypothetical protein
MYEICPAIRITLLLPYKCDPLSKNMLKNADLHATTFVYIPSNLKFCERVLIFYSVIIKFRKQNQTHSYTFPCTLNYCPFMHSTTQRYCSILYEWDFVFVPSHRIRDPFIHSFILPSSLIPLRVSESNLPSSQKIIYKMYTIYLKGYHMYILFAPI